MGPRQRLGHGGDDGSAFRHADQLSHRPQVLDILRRHIEGIKLVQAPDGMWRQVLDDTTNSSDWEETSCTGMFAYSIARAVNQGWIDPTNMAVAQKAFLGICQHVKTNGVIVGTCEGTDIGTTESYYLQRTHPDDDPHGPGRCCCPARKFC